MGELHAYVALLGGQWRSVASYRASFVVELITNLGSTALDVLAVIVLFRATRVVAGFTLPEAILMVSLSSCAFVLADFTVGNIDRLKTYVRAGTLDAVLVRPLSAMAQLLLMDLPVRKLLRLAVALATLGVGLHLNDVDWTLPRVLLLVGAPLFGAVFFGAIFVLSASLAFWWVDSGEVGSAFTYGGRDFTSYPVSVYGGWFRAVFAYGLGFGFVDEPTIGLDVTSKQAVCSFLAELGAAGDATLVLTTHNLADIERLCRRLVVIDHGRVVHDGTIEDLHARYGSRRLIVDLSSPLPPGLAIPGATVTSVEVDGHRVAFELESASAGPVVAHLAAVVSLRDLSLVEPDIEDVVARLYATTAGRGSGTP